VHSSLTPKTHALLEAWDKLTGIPILLNTSFNDNEPIVETPSQAVATMLRSGIDQLHFADYGLTVFNPAAAADQAPRNSTTISRAAP
jgi:carbamoyltransferase